MDQVVERVLLGEEVLDQRVALAARLVQKADVSTGAEGTKRAFLVAATDGHGQHPRIVLPCQQDADEVTHHAQRDGIERTRAVQRDEAHLASHFTQHIRQYRLRHFVPSNPTVH